MKDLSYLHAMMKQIFKDVYVVKPESSRNTSAEAFVVGLGFMAGGKFVMSESLSVIKQAEEPAEDDDDDEWTFWYELLNKG